MPQQASRVLREAFLLGGNGQWGGEAAVYSEQWAMEDVRRESLAKGVSCWRLKEFRKENREKTKGAKMNNSFFACFRVFRG
jgi:hypothetical protein